MNRVYETIWPDPVAERASARITAVLQDEVGVSPPSLDSLTVTIYNKATATVINGKNGTSILNTNGGTYVYAGGVGTVTLQMDPADNQLEVAGAGQEIHEVLFKFGWSTSKASWHRVMLTIAGDLKVT